MNKRIVLIAARLFFGVLALVAIGSQLVIHIGNGYSVVNFFSYFTNLSNLFAAVVLIIAAVHLITGKEGTRTGDIIRGSSVVCMALVGIVFSALLRDVDLGSLQPWVNTTLHYIMPIVVVADWLVQSPQRPLAYAKLWVWLVPPVLYLVYSLVRGAATDWYAYPFLNPNTSGGYGAVALTCVGITVTFLAVSVLLAFAANKLRPLVQLPAGELQPA
ncbi:Pr6Pr family membrane protein [Arthrobacter sp. 35W]|uniref:Pr6Pr family membrane protein n=1 Tax=Arthrobacter sp. 35W TaxID=1132441 RepID=UPI00040B1EA6|nr:Pr6Pr family membrane protein [Arthrobacter sp. 35W]